MSGKPPGRRPQRLPSGQRARILRPESLADGAGPEASDHGRESDHLARFGPGPGPEDETLGLTEAMAEGAEHAVEGPEGHVRASVQVDQHRRTFGDLVVEE